VDVHSKRAEHVAASAIRSAVRALEGAEDPLADDQDLALELLAAATTSIELARAALDETIRPDR
jgi:hypothetical protein